MKFEKIKEAFKNRFVAVSFACGLFSLITFYIVMFSEIGAWVDIVYPIVGTIILAPIAFWLYMLMNKFRFGGRIYCALAGPILAVASLAVLIGFFTGLEWLGGIGIIYVWPLMSLGTLPVLLIGAIPFALLPEGTLNGNAIGDIIGVVGIPLVVLLGVVLWTLLLNGGAILFLKIKKKLKDRKKN